MEHCIHFPFPRVKVNNKGQMLYKIFAGLGHCYRSLFFCMFVDMHIMCHSLCSTLINMCFKSISLQMLHKRSKRAVYMYFWSYQFCKITKGPLTVNVLFLSCHFFSKTTPSCWATNTRKEQKKNNTGVGSGCTIQQQFLTVAEMPFWNETLRI